MPRQRTHHTSLKQRFDRLKGSHKTWLLLLGAPALAFLLLAAYILLIVLPGLPPITALTEYQPKMPLRIYTADNVLIGEFGEERRDFVPIAKIPQKLRDAVLAVEDDDFYRHGGVDYPGLARALLANLRDSKSQGASTITMQVARNFLLTRTKTYTRKLREILLSYRIEGQLSKDQILELYMNQIYLGERAYGFSTAASAYFGKTLDQLNVAEAAMLAGLPKAPSTANPVVNFPRAKQRQQHVLKRMRKLDMLTEQEYQQALQQDLEIKGAARRIQVRAEHAVELVRQAMLARYGEEIYTHGYTVITTLTAADQQAAYAALRRGVLGYDQRHGYRGPEAQLRWPAAAEEQQALLDRVRQEHPDNGDLLSAVVLSASPKLVRVAIVSGADAKAETEIGAAGLRLAAPALAPRAAPALQLRPGSVIRVQRQGKQWAIVQLPEVAAALVALNARNGAIQALVGGFDFSRSQFDHVTQAWRQPGSTIKPFIYSAALEQGFSPATVVNDAPLENPPMTDGKVWNPGNSDGNFSGPIPMREGLKRSRNLVSIRILQKITPTYAQSHLSRFGFEPERHPGNLSMALGTGSMTPMQMAGGYAVFANGGYRIEPYLIQKVLDAQGKVLGQANPVTAGEEAERVLDPRNAWLMDSMMRDVVASGTASSAGQRLGRQDLAGKTGTTDEAMDGWFAGYGGQLVGVAWMGYDQPRSLGGREAGSTLALPIWTDFMRDALRRQPQSQRPMPEGLVQVDGDYQYQEYASGAGVESLGVPQEEGGGGFWNELFERIMPGTPIPRSPPPPESPEDKRMRELYFG